MRKTYRNEITVSVKDILLAIALIPYAIFLVLGVSGCIQSSIEYEHLDLCALFDPIVDFWFDEVIEGNILFICLAVFCVGYPCFYFLDKADEKRRPEKKKGKFKIEKSFVVFILSFIPYLFLVWSCIFGIELGFFYSVSMYYGFEAIIIAFVVGCLCPVYPITFIFQIIYIVKKHRMLTQKQRRFIIAMISLLLALLIIPSLIYLAIGK